VDDGKAEQTADRLVMAAVLLVRWLRLADPDPKLTGPQASALSVVVVAGSPGRRTRRTGAA
jgi:hypothetical protein